MNLPITLHAQSLVLDDGSPLSFAAFDATTNANYDKDAEQLRFCVQVMPGDYDVLATPPSSMHCALFAQRLTIPAADATAPGGVILSLPPSTYLNGKLRTAGDSPLSHADVQAIALNRSGGIDLPPDDATLTRYNRSSQTTSGDDGAFQLPVDLGSYDVVIKPPMDSGFPWQVLYDIAVGAQVSMMPVASVIDMPSPVVVKGTLKYPGKSAAAQMTLQDAEVAAYAIVGDDPLTKRAIPIGKSSADGSGQFMLLLPPSLQMQKNW